MLKLVGIKKRFGPQQVLQGVDLEIPSGKLTTIIGPSGEGKSVLLKHMIGLLQPDEGQVWVDTVEISHLRGPALNEVRKRFAMLFQSAALFDSLNVAENIAFVLRREGKLSNSEIKQRVEEVLEMVELPGIQQKKPSELSGGMRKRVGLARAIIYQPEIVLYDEPTTGLDPVVSDSIDQLIIRVREKLKITTVVVTHDTRSMRRVGQRILMLVNGRIYAAGAPEEIFSSQDPIVHRFVNGIADPKEMTLQA